MDTFLSAAKIMAEQDLSIVFHIAGKGPDEMAITSFIENNKLSNKVKMLGFVKDMRQFYADIDCLVIPSSREEGLCMTMLEAMSMGTALIHSDVPGIRQMTGEKKCALFFEPKNERQLAEKVIMLKNDRNLQDKLIENGIDKAKDYSLDNYMTKLNSVYHSL